jgi:hypothetical protein
MCFLVSAAGPPHPGGPPHLLQWYRPLGPAGGVHRPHIAVSGHHQVSQRSDPSVHTHLNRRATHSLEPSRPCATVCFLSRFCPPASLEAYMPHSRPARALHPPSAPQPMHCCYSPVLVPRSAEESSASTSRVLRALQPLTGLTRLHLSGLQDAASRWVSRGTCVRSWYRQHVAWL